MSGIGPDGVNAAFGFVSMWIIVINIVKLYKDKEVKGLHWIAPAFYTTWALWNLYYYAHLAQRISFLTGVGTAISYVVYLSMVLYYVRKSNVRVNDLLSGERV